MKSYTDLEQSKKIAEILPLESADMAWSPRANAFQEWYEAENTRIVTNYEKKNYIPCWSLAALLSVLPYLSLHKTFSGWRCDSYNKEGTSCILGEPLDNPVDACVEMIIKLHEQKLT